MGMLGIAVSIVINTLITMYGIRSVLDLLGLSLSKLYNVYSLGCTPKTYIILYVNCN